MVGQAVARQRSSEVDTYWTSQSARDVTRVEFYLIGVGNPGKEQWNGLHPHSLPPSASCINKSTRYCLQSDTADLRTILTLSDEPRQRTSNRMASQLLPLELIDKCVGSRIWVIMKGDKGKYHSFCFACASRNYL